MLYVFFILDRIPRTSARALKAIRFAVIDFLSVRASYVLISLISSYTSKLYIILKCMSERLCSCFNSFLTAVISVSVLRNFNYTFVTKCDFCVILISFSLTFIILITSLIISLVRHKLFQVSNTTRVSTLFALFFSKTCFTLNGLPKRDLFSPNPISSSLK